MHTGDHPVGIVHIADIVHMVINAHHANDGDTCIQCQQCMR